MKSRRIRSFLLVLVLLTLTSQLVFADDGQIFRKNVSKTPDQETERANLNHMSFYVPAQASDGTLLTEGIEYYQADGTLYETREYAKPLVAVYIDSLPEHDEEEEGIYHILSGGAGLGAHDAYAAHSLDDGATWKRTNLSLSADLSSFTLTDGTPFPGDAHNMTFAIAGDKVLVGWISRYCDGGAPLYTMVDEDVVALQDAFELPDLYVTDIWGVAGAQKSVDYTLQGFPEVGEIPYSCVWSARGQLLLDDETGTYDIVWTKAERLTSGRRDANRLEMNGDSAAGFMMTWQEDPEGLRPGQGLGPGEGWSGAVVNQQTDLWYSFIAIDDFVLVQDDTAETGYVDIAEYTGETMPKTAVPMAMPIRLTDNKMCKSTGSDLYCYVDFDDVDPYSLTDLPDDLTTIAQSQSSTFCAEVVQWTNPGNTTLNLCQTEDGRVLQGRVGASRPRVNVQPYATETIDVYDSAWVIMGAEESKALGEGSTEEDVEPEDVGKNMWYYSFDLLNPDFILQGGMLNWPAKSPETGEVFEMLVDDFGNYFYETEISRRFSHFSQPIHQIGDSGVAAALIVKQGILNQGGPADIFLRLLKVPDEVEWSDCERDGDTTTTERCLPIGYNPYAYENLVCDEWAYTDGSNPRYLEGLCLSTGINVSGGTIVSCDNGTSGEACAAAFPWDGGVSPFPKVTEWVQTVDNLDDESWENPYDVSKGHRGFIDGDFIMMMYAWSPNWKANSVGNDHYNLYARRSFDGGMTWTTTPASLGGDGTETCENYGAGSDYTTVCTDYAAGEFEQSRNLSQLTGNKVTILDPRYTPTGGLKMLPITDLKGIDFEGYDDDERDPSKFFIVYETGDNTTVAEGEAVPLDLFYSRATNWGDDYSLVEYYNSGTGETTMGFDWLEHDREDLSGEAANTCNNGGTYYYVIWNQWQEDEHENVSNSDAIFRRVMFIDVDEDNPETSVAPLASILYVSASTVEQLAGDELTIVGSARDFNAGGIVAYKWTSSIDGVVGNEKTLKMPAAALSRGKHTFHFTALDGNGHWADGTTVDVVVVEQIYRVMLPMVMRNR
ncbi:MAG: choice-of-anchor O protein [Anaerolineae bacterium]